MTGPGTNAKARHCVADRVPKSTFTVRFRLPFPVTLPPRLLPLAALLLSLPAARAQQLEGIRCPGENTMEMRHCARLSWEESDAALQRRLTIAPLSQWRQTTRAVCAHAYAPFREGSIHPQLVVGCEDHLNRALLREFAPVNNQGDPER